MDLLSLIQQRATKLQEFVFVHITNLYSLFEFSVFWGFFGVFFFKQRIDQLVTNYLVNDESHILKVIFHVNEILSLLSIDAGKWHRLLIVYVFGGRVFGAS